MNFKIILAAVFLIAPTLALAAPTYQPLVGIPGVDNPDLDFEAYLNALYALSIAVAAFLAVIKIIIGGLKWMLSDVVTSVGEAKKEIQGATIGLLVVISAVLILTTINPDLGSTNLFSHTDPTTVNLSPTTSTGKPAELPGEKAVEKLNLDSEKDSCINNNAGTWYAEANASNAWCVVKTNVHNCTGQTILFTGNNPSGIPQTTNIKSCASAEKICTDAGQSFKHIKGILGEPKGVVCI